MARYYVDASVTKTGAGIAVVAEDGRVLLVEPILTQDIGAAEIAAVLRAAIVIGEGTVVTDSKYSASIRIPRIQVEWARRNSTLAACLADAAAKWAARLAPEGAA